MSDNAYADVGDMYDVTLEREVLPEGTPATLQLTSVELEDATSKAPFFQLQFECIDEDNAGYQFGMRKYLHLVPKDPKKPKNTAFRSSLRDLVGMAAGIVGETEEEALGYFKGGPIFNGSNALDVYGHVLERLSALIGQPFETEGLGIDFDGAVTKDEETGQIKYGKVFEADGVTPKMNPKTGKQLGTYAPKQTLGRVKWLFKVVSKAA